MTDTAGPQFILGGRTEPGSSPVNQGTEGRYWSSSAYTSATNAYRLYLGGTTSAVDLANGTNKLYGLTLRCLAQ